MKQKFFLGALMAGMAVFTACSSDDEMVMPAGVGEADGDVQEIVLQVANEDGLVAKRAGRPLFSSEAAQDVDFVKIYAYSTEDNRIAKVYTIENWQTVSSVVSDGRVYKLRLTGSNKLDVGSYKFVAYAYSDGSDYEFSDIQNSWNIGTEYTAGNLTATLKSGVPDAEEVFAGENVDEEGNCTPVVVKKVTITDGDGQEQPKVEYIKGFSTSIRLARQVAGTFGYFKAIPAKISDKDVASLRLVAVAKNTKLTFNNFNLLSGDDYSGKEMYVVNGSVSAPAVETVKLANNTQAYEIYTIDLSDWFTGSDEKNGMDTNGDGVLSLGDTWTNPYDGQAKFVEGSVFAGCFVIPFAMDESKNNTFELQFLDASGAVLATRNVKLTADLQSGETNYSYNVVRNHMYNIGYKADSQNDKEEEEIEEPISLSGDQELLTNVISNWELLHHMTVE